MAWSSRGKFGLHNETLFSHPSKGLGREPGLGITCCNPRALDGGKLKLSSMTAGSRNKRKGKNKCGGSRGGLSVLHGCAEGRDSEGRCLGNPRRWWGNKVFPSSELTNRIDNPAGSPGHIAAGWCGTSRGVLGQTSKDTRLLLS